MAEAKAKNELAVLTRSIIASPSLKTWPSLASTSTFTISFTFKAISIGMAADATRILNDLYYGYDSRTPIEQAIAEMKAQDDQEGAEFEEAEESQGVFVLSVQGGGNKVAV
mgnify:CR=1 FL=1